LRKDAGLFVLRVDQLRVRGLPPLSFTVPAGECLAVEGPSGSGKSQLLRAIADLDPADGYVFVDGAERREMSGPQWRTRVRYLSAESGWWADTVGEHIPATERTDRLFQAVGFDTAVTTRLVATLSTGERQRLALVRLLGGEPRVLLLDEPTSALDQAAAALVEELIRFQLLGGRIVLLVSHDRGQIERLAHARLQLGDERRGTAHPGAAA
jgi:ABC-type iron transport system FetAB ATPase subunit